MKNTYLTNGKLNFYQLENIVRIIYEKFFKD